MKKILLSVLFAFIAINFHSCVEEKIIYQTVACFSMPSVVSAGDYINFTNCSKYADSYRWDFADGIQSNDFQPVHYYEEEGKYNVSLTAFAGNMSDQMRQTITVLPPTILSVRVFYVGTNEVVTDCSVRIYGTEQDWVDETNMIVEGMTNQNGDVDFIYMGSQEYFIDAWKQADGGSYNNWNLGYATDILIPNTINYYDVDVEYVADQPTKKYRIVSVKRVSPSDRETPLSNKIDIHKNKAKASDYHKRRQ